jgi:hypothetical protein
MGSAVPYSPLTHDVERLLQQHGGGADLAAARLADAAFSAGDDIAGDRWAKIFRILAASPVRRARQGTGRKTT